MVGQVVEGIEAATGRRDVNELRKILATDPDRYPWHRHRQFAEGAEAALVDRSAELVDQVDAPVELRDGDPAVVDSPARRPRHWMSDARPLSDRPVMTHVIGLGHVGWSPAMEAAAEDGACDLCRGKQLGPREYCLCGRSGLDGQLPPVAAAVADVEPVRVRRA